MEASRLLLRESSWAGSYCKKEMSEPRHMERGEAGPRTRTEGSEAKTALTKPGGTEASEKRTVCTRWLTWEKNWRSHRLQLKGTL